MNGRISVLGPGVGSLTAASLLRRQGWDVDVSHVARRPPPALVLNPVAQRLLDDVFGPGLLDGGHRIGMRRVRWGPGAVEAVVPTGSVGIEGEILLARLHERMPLDDRAVPGGVPDWVVDGSGRSGPGEHPSGARSRTVFGRRCVLQAEVSLAADASGSSWIESVVDGWVHLAPLATDRGVVQAMVAEPPADPSGTLSAVTAATVGIKDRVRGRLGRVSVFPAAPSLSLPLCAPGWISVADAAVSLDPISGFGTAWAVRGGILAAAVVHGAMSGLPEEECLGHYADRLREAIGDHVEQCLRLYGPVFSTPAWARELALMASARRTERERHPPAHFGYRLNGFRLERQPVT